jgi:hypothetical protein
MPRLMTRSVVTSKKDGSKTTIHLPEAATRDLSNVAWAVTTSMTALIIKAIRLMLETPEYAPLVKELRAMREAIEDRAKTKQAPTEERKELD